MRARYRPAIAGAAAIVMLAGSVSCGDVVRQGKAPCPHRRRAHCKAALVQNLEIGCFYPVRRPDAGRRVTVIFNDVARGDDAISIPRMLGTDKIGMAPYMLLNSVTINRYALRHRADGRNTPGVERHFRSTGAVTVTLTASPSVVPVEIVRHQQQARTTLRSLASFGGDYSCTIAEIRSRRPTRWAPISRPKDTTNQLSDTRPD